MAILARTISRFNVGRWGYRVSVTCTRDTTTYELSRCTNRIMVGEAAPVELINTGDTLFQALNCPDIPLWLAEEVEEGVYNV